MEASGSDSRLERVELLAEMGKLIKGETRLHAFRDELVSVKEDAWTRDTDRSPTYAM